MTPDTHAITFAISDCNRALTGALTFDYESVRIHVELAAQRLSIELGAVAIPMLLEHWRIEDGLIRAMHGLTDIRTALTVSGTQPEADAADVIAKRLELVRNRAVALAPKAAPWETTAKAAEAA